MRIYQSAVPLILLYCTSPASWAQSKAPADWGGGGSAGYEVQIDSEVKHGGQASVSLRRTSPQTESPQTGSPQDQAEFGTIVQALDAQRFAGKRVQYTGYIKSSELSDKAGLWFRVDAWDGRMVAFDNMNGRPIKGTTDWKKYEIVLDVPDDGSLIYFGALLIGDGTIWMDDLAISEVGTDVKVTAKRIQGHQPTKKPGAEPLNLDFEN